MLLQGKQFGGVVVDPGSMYVPEGQVNRHVFSLISYSAGQTPHCLFAKSEAVAQSPLQ
jgi:hypothetical protein